MDAVRKPGAPDPSIPWLIGVARHKLADHWRRVERVRAADGRADEPEPKPYGLIAECTDDQGATFRLWQPTGRPKR